MIEAGDDGDTGDAVDANDAGDDVDDEDDDDAGSASNPPAYSPTHAWMYEPIISLDSNSECSS